MSSRDLTLQTCDASGSSPSTLLKEQVATQATSLSQSSNIDLRLTLPPEPPAYDTETESVYSYQGYETGEFLLSWFIIIRKLFTELYFFILLHFGCVRI